jgi:thiamine phosphate synthase YjbQ (UPF0047 family)
LEVGEENTMHITASAFINDDESGLHEDYERWLERASRLDSCHSDSNCSGV